MTTIITRVGKGTTLSFHEVDQNFTNLNDDKLENDGGAFLNGTIDNCTIGATTATSGKFTTLETSSDVTITGNLTVNGTTTNINTTNLVVEDKNIILGDVTSPTNTTADGGGITLKGTADKTFNWVNSTSAWTSSEHLNLASGKAYYINGTWVLNNNTLGSGITASSLTSVGTLTTLSLADPNNAVIYSNGGTGAFYLRKGNSGSYTDQLILDASGNGTFAGSVIDSKGNVRNTPISTTTTTLVAADAGKTVTISAGITCNASVFSAGEIITLVNTSAGPITITAGSNVTFRLAGTATTGNRTLAGYGLATLVCTVGGATPTFYVSGAGLS